MPIRTHQARAAAVVVVLAALAFLVLVVVGGPFFPSFDEAKYVGLGRNIYAGLGYTTVFGGPFTTHPPGWPLILVGPEHLLGVDVWTWGRAVNTISGAAIILMAGVAGARIRPAAGALAAAAVLAVPYLGDLSRTARLDVPNAAVTVLAVLAGVSAVERASSRRAIVAGLCFALAFVIKETSLVMLAAPPLAGLFLGQRPSVIARTTAWMVLMLAVGGGWWFAMIGLETGLVYRTSAPAWLLVPGAVLLGVAIVLGLFAEPIAARLASRRGSSAEGEHAGPGRLRPVLGLVLSLAWALVLFVVLSRSPELAGAGVFDRRQIASWLSTWGTTIRPPLLFVAIGVAFAAVAWILDRRDADRAGAGANRARANADALPAPGVSTWHWGTGAALLVPALVASVPLVVFVIATGEPPRNDFAPLALGVAAGAAGWLAIAEHAARVRPLAGALVAAAVLGGLAALTVGPGQGLPHTRVLVVAGAAAGIAWVGMQRLRVRRASLATAISWLSREAALVLVLGVAVAATVVSGIHVRRTPGGAGTSARGVAVQAIDDWVHAHVPEGSTIAVGSLLGNEVAIALGGLHAIKLAAQQAAVVPGTPFGLSVRPGDSIDDWLSLDPHPRKSTAFLAFSARSITNAVALRAPTVWIYVTGETTASPSIVPSLTPEHGFTTLAHWSWPNGKHTLDAWIFGVDSSRVSFADAPLVASPQALDRLVGLLTPTADGPAIARRLEGRIQVSPAGPDADAALIALQRLAGGP